MNRLERLEALADKATLRPWDAQEGVIHEFIAGGSHRGWIVGSQYPHGIATCDMDAPEANAQLIVAAVNALPDLLAAVRAAYGIAANARPIRESSLTQLAQGDTGKTVGWVMDCEAIEANRTALEPLYREEPPDGR